MNFIHGYVVNDVAQVILLQVEPMGHKHSFKL